MWRWNLLRFISQRSLKFARLKSSTRSAKMKQNKPKMKTNDLAYNRLVFIYFCTVLLGIFNVVVQFEKVLTLNF